jgi:uncharacterized protein (DUF302 family)
VARDRAPAASDVLVRRDATLMSGRILHEEGSTLIATPTVHGYGFGTTLAVPFDEAVARTKAALQSEGFGVLSEIDVQATLRAKLGVAFERYLILGACNPQLAHRALQVEHELGLLLPCNVIVHEHDGQSAVSIVDPATMLGIVENEALRDVADEAKARLERVVTKLAAE